MLSNLHTHTTFCDGADTPEDMVKAAIEKGFASLGFSGHGYMDFDESYCMLDTDEYITEITALKEKYKDKIQIYLGVEEDIICPVNRKPFNYVISSLHYVKFGEQNIPIDEGVDTYKKALALFSNNPIALAKAYYDLFIGYIEANHPQIIGHFDLITKYDEKLGGILLNNAEYNHLAENYISKAAQHDCFFEVNTGAIARGFRTNPYPSENLLYALKKNGAKLILNSDSHSVNTLDYFFNEAALLLKSIGFTHTYILYNNEFIKNSL